jgi:phosphoglucosamine mutase
MVDDMLHFGTDGVRGRAGVDLVAEDVAALGAVVAGEWPDAEIVIGHDGRESGVALVAAFSAGATARGSSVTNAGLLPTPALAGSARLHHRVAVSVTASHNPWHDNGVKVFAPGGRKLRDDEQRRIESRWHSRNHHVSAFGGAVSPSVDDSVAAEYVRTLVAGSGVTDFGGRELVIDCANGATSTVAPNTLAALGLRPDVHNAAPNGRNINDECGAVHPESVAALCAARGVPGLAFDGDGDRLIAIDELGRVVDGDRIIALMAVDLHESGSLVDDTVVVTSMTNLGFHHAMQRHGIKVVTTDVGDRAILAAMDEGGFVLGGEQSGHIINALHATTGDGLLAAILLLDLVRRKSSRLSDLAESVMESLPQLLRNVRVATKPSDVEALLGDDLVRERAALGVQGRIVVRASGTEPVVRIMVEATSLPVAEAVADRLERILLLRA